LNKIFLVCIAIWLSAAYIYAHKNAIFLTTTISFSNNHISRKYSVEWKI